MQVIDYSKLTVDQIIGQKLPGDSVSSVATMKRCQDCGMPAWWATDTCRHCGWHMRCANRTDGKTGKVNPDRPARWITRQRAKSFKKRLAERGETW